jgi:hypothetical protein
MPAIIPNSIGVKCENNQGNRLVVVGVIMLKSVPADEQASLCAITQMASAREQAARRSDACRPSQRVSGSFSRSEPRINRDTRSITGSVNGSSMSARPWQRGWVNM